MRLSRVVFALLALLVLTVSPFAQDPEQEFSRVRESLRDVDLSTAASRLKDIESSQPKYFREHHLDYLLGRTLEDSGDIAGAAKEFVSTADSGGPLRVYALWHLSNIARASGNLFLERIYLNDLAAFDAATFPGLAARARMAESLLASGDYAPAIRILSADAPGANASIRAPALALERQRKRLALLAKAYVLGGDTVNARSTFEVILSGTPNADQPDDNALAAVNGLDSIDTATGVVLSAAEHMRRAAVYQFNRDFSGARGHFLAVVNQSPDIADAPKAVFEIGRGYVQERNFSEAVKWFERDRDQTADPLAARESLLQSASAYARMGKQHEAVLRYQKYIELYPTDPHLDRAYLNLVDTLRDAGEETDALRWAADTESTFKGKLPETLAIFAESRIYLARGDWATAQLLLDKLTAARDLGGASVPGGTNTAEIQFLRGYSLERLERFPQAVDVYLAIADGRGEYYGWRSTLRLQNLAKQPASSPAIEAKLTALEAEIRPGVSADDQRSAAASAFRLAVTDAARSKYLEALTRSYGQLPRYKKYLKPTGAAARKPPAPQPNDKSLAGILIGLGLFDEAAPEYEASLKKIDSQAAGLAEIYALGDRADRSIALMQPFTAVYSDQQIELIDPKIIQVLYPVPFRRLLLSDALPRGVDPRFMLSIIRQESGFRSTIKSNAAARGLMQFVPGTAMEISRELGREVLRDDDLYDPVTSILFGSRYSEKLFDLFPGLPDAVAAAYNGGEDNMKRWLSRTKSREPDRYVPEIAFAQSKDYVYRVMSTYRVYCMLYNEKLKVRESEPTDGAR